MKPPHPGARKGERRLDFRTLKRQVSIQQVLQHAGVLHTLKHGHGNLTGPCPIHRGDNPHAFVVSKAKQLWRCFTRCDAGGDLIELVKRLYRCSYRDVAVRLAERVGAGDPRLPLILPPSPAVPQVFTPFTSTLPIRADHPFLRHKRIHQTTAARFEVGYYRGRGFLERSIAVRLHDGRAQPLGYAARHLDTEHLRAYGKWKFPPRLPKASLLYNLHRLREPRTVVLVECPWGVLRLHQLGIPALALLGTHLSDQQRQKLRPFPRLVLLMDGDQAGRRAAARLAERLRGHHQLFRADIPDGLDPDQLEDRALLEVLRPFLF